MSTRSSYRTLQAILDHATIAMCSQICSLLSSLNNSFGRSPPGPSTSSADPLPLSRPVACLQGLHHLLPAGRWPPWPSTSSTRPPPAPRPVARPQGPPPATPGWSLAPRASTSSLRRPCRVAQSPTPSTSSPDSLRRPRRVARSPTPSTSSPNSLRRPRRVAATFTCLGTSSRLVLQEP
jgi:hypothetical protein